jgi:hypothetical protein
MKTTNSFFPLRCLLGSYIGIQQILENTFFVLFNPIGIHDFGKEDVFQTFKAVRVRALSPSMGKTDCR